MLKQGLFFLIFSILCTLSFAEEFEAGKDYQVLKDQTPKADSDAIGVIEFFSYGCPWCYRIDDGLKQWAHKNETVINYQQIPVVFHKDWKLYAKAYYIAQALSLKSILSPLLFKAIIEDKHSLKSNQAMIEFFKQHGVAPSVASSAFLSSPSIEMQVNKSMRLMARYQINAVPALVVNNEYKTDLQMAKSQERLFEILDYLVNKSK